MSVDELRGVLEATAPGILAKIQTQTGDDSGAGAATIAAVASLHEQFTMAHHKLRTPGAAGAAGAAGGAGDTAAASHGNSNGISSLEAASSAMATHLKAQHDWAASKEENLSRGLQAGMFKTTLLRMASFTVGTSDADTNTNTTNSPSNPSTGPGSGPNPDLKITVLIARYNLNGRI